MLRQFDRSPLREYMLRSLSIRNGGRLNPSMTHSSAFLWAAMLVVSTLEWVLKKSVIGMSFRLR